MADEPDSPHRDHNLYRGIVTNNVDAAKMGRVRVRVPGIFEPDALCECVMPGSPFNQGIFVVPAIGAEVLVGFLQGEYDSPVVLGGFVPPVVAGSGRAAIDAAELPKLLTIENAHWRLTLGHADTAVASLSIVRRPAPDEPEDATPTRIVLDMAQGFCLVELPKGIQLKTPGLLSLDGRLTQVRGHPITEGTEPI
jgi:hypothetical protein